MALFETVKELMANRPPNLKKPYFYKSDSDAKRQLEQLQAYLKTAPLAVKPRVEQDIKMLSYGIFGEEQVAFELNNSYLPMIILKDLHIVHDGLSAQIDYLLITTKFQLIIECKNLIGNIEITNQGDFIRTTEFNGRKKREGIYSPITQNIRHMEMIRKVRSESKSNAFFRSVFDKNFSGNYKSVVVLANPKTIVDVKHARKEIKDQIIRCDQLVEYIKRLLNESKVAVSLERQIYEMADFFMNCHTPNQVDYTSKYRTADIAIEAEPTIQPAAQVTAEAGSNSATESTGQIATNNQAAAPDSPLYLALKQYRLEKSREEGVKAYFLFNNAQLEELLAVMPQSIVQLKTIQGFGDVKCEKYGQDILRIIKDLG